jgi:hypothetical protein
MAARIDGVDSAHRIIEMLEERFGRFWANCLLIAIVVAVVTWCLNTFVVDFFIPLLHIGATVFSYLSGVKLSFPRVATGVYIFWTNVFPAIMGCAAVYYLYVGRIAVGRLGRRFEEAKALGDSEAGKIRASQAGLNDEFARLSVALKAADELDKQRCRTIEHLVALIDVMAERMPVED